MSLPRLSGTAWDRLTLSLLIGVFLAASCSPPIKQPSGPESAYLDALDMFKQGRLDRAIEFTDDLATAKPPIEYTNRARVLRVVIYTGQMRGDEELSDAYEKGMKKAHDPSLKARYGEERNDTLQSGSKDALNLAQTAMELLKGGALPNDLALQAPYPDAEGPTAVAQLTRVEQGMLIGTDDQESAAIDAARKGIDDTLADVAGGGDRSTARSALAAGPVKLNDLDFDLFLTKDLVDAAGLFDSKHEQDPSKRRVVAGIADNAASAGMALLKDHPDKDKEKEFKKLQDQIKTLSKTE